MKSLATLALIAAVFSLSSCKTCIFAPKKAACCSSGTKACCDSKKTTDCKTCKH